MVELLLVKIPDVSQYLFRREGVLHEVESLASVDLYFPQPSKDGTITSTTSSAVENETGPDVGTRDVLRPSTSIPSENVAAPPAAAKPTMASTLSVSEKQIHDLATLRARFVRDRYCSGSSNSAKQAREALDSIRTLAESLATCSNRKTAAENLAAIAKLFSTSTEHPMSSFEMLESGLVDSLLAFALEPASSARMFRHWGFIEDWLTDLLAVVDSNVRRELLARAFSLEQADSDSASGFPTLVKRLQESLSRLEDFDVVAALQSPSDDRRNSASMLARQLKLRLVSEDADIPKSCATVTVSIHAIATFQAFHDYLRPRITAATALADRAGAGGSRLTGALAAFAAASRLGTPDQTASPASSAPNSPSKLRTATDSTEVAEPGKPVRRRSTRLSAKASSDNIAGTSTPDADGAALDAAESNAVSLTLLFTKPTDDVQIMADTGNDDAAEPPAVTVAPAADGSKLEGVTPGGTRVATPVQGQSAGAFNSSPRPKASYAAALRAEPTDWHLEFSMDGRPVSLETTIYGAVHQHEARQLAPSSRTLWSNTHVVHFRKVTGPTTSQSM